MVDQIFFNLARRPQLRAPLEGVVEVAGEGEGARKKLPVRPRLLGTNTRSRPGPEELRDPGGEGRISRAAIPGTSLITGVPRKAWFLKSSLRRWAEISGSAESEDAIA